MDKTLLVLLAEAWKTGERADVLALVDRIKEAPPEEVVETFLAFRQATQSAATLADLFKKVGTQLAAEVKALAAGLWPAPQEPGEAAGPRPGHAWAATARAGHDPAGAGRE
jgi:hypothetical protein